MKRILIPLLCLAASVTQAQDYQRIVSAGGDLTEIIVALGAGDRLIGVDSTSSFPAEMQEKPQIGYVRALSAEGLLSLTPDLLIGAHDTGPETVLDQLRATGLEVAIAPDGSDAESVAAKTIFVGEVLGLEAEASTLVTAYRAEMAKVAEAVAALDRAPRVLFILSIRDGAPLVGGQATSADEMIRLAGGQNAAAGIEGYKPMNREAIIAAAPDVILMTDAHADRLGGLDDVLTRPEIALTPAGRDKAGVLMPAMLLLGMGPRTAEGVRQLARALHPDQAAQIGQ